MFARYHLLLGFLTLSAPLVSGEEHRIEWQTLASSKQQFQVRLPGKPEHKEQTSRSLEGKPIITHCYTVDVGPNIFSVAVTELPFDWQADGIPLKVFYDGERKGELDAADGELLGTKALTMGKLEGHEYVYRFLAADRESTRVTKSVSYVVGRRHYNVRLNARGLNVIEQHDLGGKFFKSFSIGEVKDSDPKQSATYENVTDSTWIRARSAAAGVEGEFPKRPEFHDNPPKFMHREPDTQATFEVICLPLGAIVKDREGDQGKLKELYATVTDSMLRSSNGKLGETRDRTHDGRIARRVDWTYSPTVGPWRGSALLVAAGEMVYVASFTCPAELKVDAKDVERFLASLKPLAAVPKGGADKPAAPKVKPAPKVNVEDLKQKLIGKWAGEVVLVGGAFSDRVGEEWWIFSKDGTYETVRFNVTLRTTTKGMWKVLDSGLMELTYLDANDKSRTETRGLEFGDRGVTIKAHGCSEETRLSRMSFPKAEEKPRAPRKEGKEPAGGSKTEKNMIDMTLVRVSAATFEMGVLPADEFAARFRSAASEEQRFALLAFAPPRRSTTIAKDYLIGSHEVTIGQFRRFVTTTKYQTEAERDGKGGTGRTDAGSFEQQARFNWQTYGFAVSDDCPVANVTWNDAVAFCEWLTKTEGKRYRLPTEAEWEYACRAGTTTAYSFGENREDMVAYGNGPDQELKRAVPELSWVMKGNDRHAYLAPVGKFKPNAFGLCDMHGNVIEWCADEYSITSPLGKPNMPGGEVEHVHRGGNWFSEAETAGSGCRSGSPRSYRNSLTGFRVVRECD